MSRTFKDTPVWVRERRNHSCREVHTGCPCADEPRLRYTVNYTETEPYWHQEKVTVRRFIAPAWMLGEPSCGDWWGERTHLTWRYSATVERHAGVEPYWVDVCDLDVRDERPSLHCHYETELDTPHLSFRFGRSFDPDGSVRRSKRRRREYDRSDRRNAAAVLREAASEWNSFGATDLQPWHTLTTWWD